MKKATVYFFLIPAMVFLCGCARQNTESVRTPSSLPQKPVQEISEKSCQKDTDCGCGKRKDTGQCFVGNVEYIDPALGPCPDFCGGIDGKMTPGCVDGKCRQIRKK